MRGEQPPDWPCNIIVTSEPKGLFTASGAGLAEWHIDMQEVYVKMETDKLRHSEMQAVIATQEVGIKKLTEQISYANQAAKDMEKNVDQAMDRSAEYNRANIELRQKNEALKSECEYRSRETRNLLRQISRLRKKAGLKKSARAKP